jgi:hypothetical protein
MRLVEENDLAEKKRKRAAKMVENTNMVEIARK